MLGQFNLDWYYRLMQYAKTRDMGDDIKNRSLFDQQAQVYDEIRPLYPGKLFDTLVGKTNLHQNAKLLEIGPGTGQATLPLAKRGYQIVAVELGEGLATVARKKLRDYSNVEIITSSFEDESFHDTLFDLIYSATAFHWLDHDIRYSKSHKLLKSNGHLAFIQTNHVSDERGDLFYYASQPIYDKYMPRKDKTLQHLPLAYKLGPESYEPTASLDTELFKLVYFEQFPIVLEYNGDEYIKLIGTYSPHLVLPPAKRTAFFKELRELINISFSGRVTKNYAMSLAIAQKLTI